MAETYCKWCLGILILLATTAAQAQTVVVFQIMPPGHDGQVQGVGRARYYLLDEYLKLAEFDAELVKLRLDLQELQGIEKALKDQLAAKGKIIEGLEHDKTIMASRGLRLEGNLKTCEESLVKCQSPDIWPYIVGAVGVAFGMVGMGIWLGSR